MPPLQDTIYVHAEDATVAAPADAELAAGAGTASTAGALANGTAWLGCVSGAGLLMDGEVAGVVEGVASPEDCCRRCRALGGAACNAWSWCGGRHEACE